MKPSQKLGASIINLRKLALASIACVTLSANAATVWTGPLITYTQPAAHNPTIPSNQDRITDRVWLTRAKHDRMFNAKTETFCIRGVSPADTEWATGTLANIANLKFKDFSTWVDGLGGGRVSTKIVGINAVCHLKTDDIYFSIKFSSWTPNGVGGYSYQRSTPAAAVPPTVTITTPANAAEFVAPASVDVVADAAVTGGTVTNVAFFANTTSLGSDQTAPFRVTASNLGAGSYALTAVATAAGISTTSSVVNIKVISPPSPTITITGPANATVFAAPAKVQLVADAAVTGGSVTNVEFFGNLVSFGNVKAPPFRITTPDLSAGAYALRAVATAAGISSTSSVVNITVVTPVTITSSLPQIANGRFSFDYTANPGLVYSVQNSSNLLDWVPIVTNTATSSPVHFSDDFVPTGARFYRVKRLPNPQ